MLPLVFTMMLLPLDCPCTAAPPSIWMYPSFPVLLEETSSSLRGGTVVMEIQLTGRLRGSPAEAGPYLTAVILCHLPSLTASLERIWASPLPS